MGMRYPFSYPHRNGGNAFNSQGTNGLRVIDQGNHDLFGRG